MMNKKLLLKLQRICVLICIVILSGIFPGCDAAEEKTVSWEALVGGINSCHSEAFPVYLYYATFAEPQTEAEATRIHVLNTMQNCMEAHLPDLGMVCRWLPPYVEMMDYAEGDIGNDGMNDIAVLFYAGPEESDYYDCILMVYSQNEENYELVCLKDTLVWYGDEVEITDGKLYISQNPGPQDYQCNTFGFEKLGEELVLCEFIEEFGYEQTAQGERIIYDFDNLKAEAYAFTTREDGFEPWLLYTADAENFEHTLDEISNDSLPHILYDTREYTPDGISYVYHALPIDTLSEGRQLEDWQLAYLDLFQYFVLEEFKENEWYYEHIWFSLVYIDDDDIPELVMEMENQFTSLYAYTPGADYNGVQNISTIMNDWGLARGHIGPRCYLPYEDLFCFEYYGHDWDYDAGYRSFWYATTSANRDDLDKVYELCRREFEGDYETEEDDVIKYYYNDEEITKEEYDYYQIEGDYRYLDGDKYIYEIVEEMLEQ